jgi:hypothetical protein
MAPQARGHGGWGQGQRQNRVMSEEEKVAERRRSILANRKRLSPHAGGVGEVPDSQVISQRWPCSITGYPERDEEFSFDYIRETIRARVLGDIDIKLTGRCYTILYCTTLY